MMKSWSVIIRWVRQVGALGTPLARWGSTITISETEKKNIQFCKIISEKHKYFLWHLHMHTHINIIMHSNIYAYTKCEYSMINKFQISKYTYAKKG